MIIEFKDSGVLSCCLKTAWHPKLIEVLTWLSENFQTIVITEGWREQLHVGDIHTTEPLRAFDIRSYVFKEPKLIEEKINKRWIYDPIRPEKQVAWLHDTGQGMHFHVQVHPRTECRTV